MLFSHFSISVFESVPENTKNNTKSWVKDVIQGFAKKGSKIKH